MSKQSMISKLKELLEHFDEIEGEISASVSRDAALGNPLYLNSETCPTGMHSCDYSSGVCPDDKYAPLPAIYNSSGMRCYNDDLIEHTVRMSKKQNTQVNIREFVEMAATLSSELQKKAKDLACVALDTQELCGIRDSCTWNEKASECVDN